MTEDEAAKVECPATFSGRETYKCVGSRCMAWRWESIKFHRMKDGSLTTNHGTDTPRYGYCGLAGKP